MTLIGAIDQGTSSTRFVIFDAKTGNIVANNQIEIKTICPRPGWVEMDPNEIYTTTTECIENACKQLVKNGFKTVDIKAVGIANQRETTIIWDRNSGKPICNAIVWLDSRTSELAEEFGKKTPTGSKEYFKTKTGLPIHPYFSALKIRWLIDNNDAVRHSVSSGQAMFGNVDSWIIWKLTGAHVTDVTNASRTLLLDLHKVKWSTEMCTFFDIPIAIMPEIRSSSEFYGSIREGILKGVPITGCLGDQQASLIGHACMRMCETKVTYGTGTFMLCNIGQNIIISKKGLLTTIAFQFGKGKPMFYALEGSGSIGGTAVKFIRDNLNFIKKSSEIEQLAAEVNDTDGVVFVPCFSGLFTPYWDPTAKGLLCGLTQGTKKAHIARAALEACCFQMAEMLEAVECDMNGVHQISTIKIDGGMTVNELFNQIQSDILGRKIIRPAFTEMTAMGACIAAQIGIGMLSFEELLCREVKEAKAYQPNSTFEERRTRLNIWKDAVRRALHWNTQTNIGH